MLQQVTARLTEAAGNLDSKVNDFFVIRQKGIESLSKNKTIGMFLLEPDKIDIAQIQDLFLTLADNYTELSLLDNTGMEIARVVRGRVSVKLKNQNQQDFFTLSMGKESFYLESSADHGGGKRSIDISKSVLDPYEEPIGVIGGHIAYDKLYAMIETALFYKDFTVQIFDKKKRSVIGEPASFPQDTFTDNVQSQKKLFRTKVGGHDSLVAFASVKDLGWTVIVSLPNEKFERNIGTLKKSIFFVAFVIIIIGVILSLILSQKLSKPILLLTEASKSISDGDFSTRSDIKTNDEINDLAVSFNTMVEEINNSRQKIITTRDYLEAANQEFNNLIQRATTDVSARYENTSLVKCWEVKNCDEKDCPSYQSDNLRCWQVAGTFCDGEIQGYFAKKYENCHRCDVYQNSVLDPSSSIGENFNNMMHILQLKQQELERTYVQLKNTQSQLVQQEKMASIGTLSGGIAHEFNNILGGIIGYTELAMLDIPEGSETRADLDQILTAGHRAKDLVRQILSFSRQSEEELQPIQIHYVIKEAIKLLQTTTPSSIEVRHNIDTDCKNVLASSTKVHQILINLYTNAVQAMGDKGILEIRLRGITHTGDDKTVLPAFLPGEYVQLTISDNGPGIEPTIKDRIFDPFFTTKEVGRGTGMGLSVVHGIVKNFGGLITVDSEPGKGASFHVYLPAITGELGQGHYDQSQEPTLRGNENILFVDDEVMLSLMGKQILENFGYKVSAKTSAIEALEEFRAQPEKFDLIITDQTMPHITGDELAKIILKIRPDMPIILCTGYSSTLNKDRARDIGIRAFVMKPVDKRMLTNTIRQVLDGGESV